VELPARKQVELEPVAQAEGNRLPARPVAIAIAVA
jgi:hypothetical protein